MILPLATGIRRLQAVQWIVIGIYLFYLAASAAIGCYDRYSIWLLGVNVRLMICATDRLLVPLARKDCRLSFPFSSKNLLPGA